MPIWGSLYGASKNALQSYTRAAGKELARFGVTANLIVPGATQTGWITQELEKIIYPMYLRGESDSLKILIDVITMLASKRRKSKFQTSPMPGRRTSSSLKKRSIASTSRRRVPYAPQPLNVFLSNREGEIRGGLIGIVQAGWLHIGTLWIHVRYRRRGYEAELMRSAEAEACASGCKHAWLDTFEFQARAFYERLGYKCFGVLNDHPIKHTHYFMYKRLS